MDFFDRNGRRIPDSSMRVFSQTGNDYYNIVQPEISYDEIFSRSIGGFGASDGVSSDDFESVCDSIRERIGSDPQLKNLLNGIHVPFILFKSENNIDIGEDIENRMLPAVGRSFNHMFPDNHFKATLQGGAHLPEHVFIANKSRYERLIQAMQTSSIAGWYFPQALKEFDIESQREQMSDLPNMNGLCLSGIYEIAAALVGSPDLLVNSEIYSPILCGSALKHTDERLCLMFKAHGPHLEFWCMSQMLAPTVKQVSEQWSGGITIYRSL